MLCSGSPNAADSFDRLTFVHDPRWSYHEFKGRSLPASDRGRLTVSGGCAVSGGPHGIAQTLAFASREFQPKSHLLHDGMPLAKLE